MKRYEGEREAAIGELLRRYPEQPRYEFKMGYRDGFDAAAFKCRLFLEYLGWRHREARTLGDGIVYRMEITEWMPANDLVGSGLRNAVRGFALMYGVLGRNGSTQPKTSAKQLSDVLTKSGSSSNG